MKLKNPETHGKTYGGFALTECRRPLMQTDNNESMIDRKPENWNVEEKRATTEEYQNHKNDEPPTDGTD